MQIDVYSATGVKKGTVELPKAVFGATINEGLMHQALVLQQSNRRTSISHAKTRGEVVGSTAKLYRQKGTGRARAGSANSPTRRSGGKAFGPRSDHNYQKDMPKKMRRAALMSCLSLQANSKAIIGLEGVGKDMKTKKAMELLSKLPVEIGRKILFVTTDVHRELKLSVRNIPNVKVITVGYLNPEDVLVSKKIVFLVDALNKLEEIFTAKAKPAEKSKAPNTKAQSSKLKTQNSKLKAQDSAKEPTPKS